MLLKAKLVIALAVVAVETTPSTAAPARSSLTSSTPAKGGPVARSAAAVPPALRQLESAAEDIGDDVERGRWGNAAALAARAARDLDSLGPLSPPATMSEARKHLEQARTSIRERQALPAQFAANALSGDVVDLFSRYQPVVPIGVMRLDVLLRRAELQGLARKPQGAESPFAQARAIWIGLKQQPPLASTETARRFDQQMSAIEQAIASGDARALQKSASAALEGVDALERVFESAHRTK